MNKKTVMIASGAAGLILTLSACGTETYEYQVSGTVQDQWLDYDCPGEDIAMDAVAFVAGTGKGSSTGGGGKGTKSDSKGSSKKDSGDGDKDKKGSDKKKNEQSKKPSTGTASSGGSTGGTSKSSPTAKASTKNKGVKLKSKPEKAEKIKNGKLPKPKYRFKPEGCDNEYEIFVLDANGDLYEQDVRKADYDKCLAAKVRSGQSKKLFPLCTKG